MDIKDFVKSLQESSAPDSADSQNPWAKGYTLQQRVKELKKSGSSQGCSTRTDVIMSEGLSRTEGYLWLQIVSKLDPDQYGHLPLKKLGCLAQLSEEERKQFMATYDVETLSVRQLKAKVKEWKNKDLGSQSEPEETESGSTDSPASETDSGTAVIIVEQLLERCRQQEILHQEIVALLKQLIPEKRPVAEEECH